MYASHSLDKVFYALSDATRRHIIERLGSGELTINQIASAYDVSLADISKHVKVLHEAGLVHKRRSGRHVFVGLDAEGVHRAYEYVTVLKEVK